MWHDTAYTVIRQSTREMQTTYPKTIVPTVSQKAQPTNYRSSCYAVQSYWSHPQWKVG